MRKEDGSLSSEMAQENISMVGMTLLLVGKKIQATEMLKRTGWRMMMADSAWTR